jgi:hypothetical protein
MLASPPSGISGGVSADVQPVVLGLLDRRRPGAGRGPFAGWSVLLTEAGLVEEVGQDSFVRVTTVASLWCEACGTIFPRIALRL